MPKVPIRDGELDDERVHGLGQPGEDRAHALLQPVAGAQAGEGVAERCLGGVLDAFQFAGFARRQRLDGVERGRLS